MLRKTLLASAFILAGAFSANAATITLFEDDFGADSANVGSYVTVTSLTNWNVTQGNVDILGAGYCSGCIDLDGSGASGATIMETKTAFTLLANTIYTV